MDDERLKQLVKLTGKSRLVLDLSCRKKVLLLSTNLSPLSVVFFIQPCWYVWQMCGDHITTFPFDQSLAQICNNSEHGVFQF